MRPERTIAAAPAVIFGTSFIEGAAVLVVEIAGARTLAPFYGASLVVWTSQITATLLFLALGYLAGGWLSRRWQPSYLSSLFVTAGLWLCLVPTFRSALLNATAPSLGIAAGSFVSACIMFGLPLACFGAVSPVLIEQWNRVRPGAGGAAGIVFFVSTIGGLTGAWLTALILVPRLSMRVSILACGLLLVAVGAAWRMLMGRRQRVEAVSALVGASVLVAIAPTPVMAVDLGGQPLTVVYAKQSSVGLIQVLDLPGFSQRMLLVDGIVQSGMHTQHGYCMFEFTEYLNVMGYGYHTGAKNALLLGLGSGCLARQLHARGVRVTAIEVDPKIIEVARGWFGLPGEVTVIEGDARTAMKGLSERFDLVFGDVFVGESVPWYLFTREGLEAARNVLTPGGRLLVNFVTTPEGSPGLERVEASMANVFDATLVHIEPQSREPNGLVNATLVGGRDLVWSPAPMPSRIDENFGEAMARMKANVRPAREGARVGTDDLSDLDFADARIRLKWRALSLGLLDARLLAD